MKIPEDINKNIYDHKTDGYGSLHNDDYTFDGELKVTITLHEYRDLVKSDSISSNEISKIRSEKYKLEDEIKQLKAEKEKLKERLLNLLGQNEAEVSEDDEEL